MLCHATSLCAVSSAWNVLPVHLLGKLLPTLEAPVQMPHPLCVLQKVSGGGVQPTATSFQWLHVGFLLVA